MGVTRTELAFEGNFTQLPNAWLRDARISRRAKGLLAEIFSHRVDWHVTISTLQKAGTEGRDALRSTLEELKTAGYLAVVQGRGELGRWKEVEYVLRDPFSAVGFSDSGSSDSGPADSGGSDTKKTKDKEDHQEELLITSDEATPSEGAALFDEFWSVYPRKVGKQKAILSFMAAVKAGTPAAVIVAGAKRYSRDPNLPKERRYIPHPSTWLFQGRWSDEAEAPRGDGPSRQASAVDVFRKLREEEQRAEVGHRPAIGAGAGL